MTEPCFFMIIITSDPSECLLYLMDSAVSIKSFSSFSLFRIVRLFVHRKLPKLWIISMVLHVDSMLWTLWSVEVGQVHKLAMLIETNSTFIILRFLATITVRSHYIPHTSSNKSTWFHWNSIMRHIIQKIKACIFMIKSLYIYVKVLNESRLLYDENYKTSVTTKDLCLVQKNYWFIVMLWYLRFIELIFHHKFDFRNVFTLVPKILMACNGHWATT